jgi:hypothetical protein
MPQFSLLQKDLYLISFEYFEMGQKRATSFFARLYELCSIYSCPTSEFAPLRITKWRCARKSGSPIMRAAN